jgi:hypothetical protein
MDMQQVTRDNLRNVMDFDHVIEVHEDGTVTDAASAIWAPEVSVVGGDYRNPAIDAQSGRVWSLMTGYSGQYLYHGPIMHDSEYIGGRMADDILSEPGVYVAVVVSDNDAATEDETPDAGWAVAKLDNYAPDWP